MVAQNPCTNKNIAHVKGTHREESRWSLGVTAFAQSAYALHSAVDIVEKKLVE